MIITLNAIVKKIYEKPWVEVTAQIMPYSKVIASWPLNPDLLESELESAAFHSICDKLERVFGENDSS